MACKNCYRIPDDWFKTWHEEPVSEKSNYVYVPGLKVIEGRECVKNPALCFNRSGNKFATTISDIRVYKKTFNDGESHNKALTTLIIPANSKIHLPYILHADVVADADKFAKAQKYSDNKKARSDTAFVEESELLLSNMKIPVAHSIRNSWFKYRTGSSIREDKFNDMCFDVKNKSNYCTDSEDNTSVCDSGIHFFFEKSDAENYRY
jgi:hypothetical protein